MKLTGLRRAAARWLMKDLRLTTVDSSRGWFTLYDSGERRIGGWQQDDEISEEGSLRNPTTYACTTLIASDIGKICVLLKRLEKKVWVEADSAAFSPVLRKPNHFQTRQQFVECWVLSKLNEGNAYILKQRDNRNVVTALYVLDPQRVTPLVAPDGSVYYRLNRDDLSKQPNEMIAVPASEIIHDRMECLFHPLVGISPLFAAYLAATQGLRIQQNSERFFRNASRPGGMLTAPETIDDQTAQRLKTEFEQKYSGANLGRLFVAGDGLEYKPLAVDAVNAQLVEQAKLSDEKVCTVYHVPAYMVGVGQAPSFDNVEALNQQYYQQCLQKLFNAIEDLLDDGLGIAAAGYRVEFDLDDLIRMDSRARAEVIERLSKTAIIAPNEGRAKFGYLPVDGGDTPYLQVQNASLAALAARDANSALPGSPGLAPEQPKPPDAAEAKAALEAARFLATLTKGLEHV